MAIRSRQSLGAEAGESARSGTGLGNFDLADAEGDAIRAGTWTELNEYLWRSAMINRYLYYKKEAYNNRIRDAAIDAIRERKLVDPTAVDVESGDALNAILFQLGDPTVNTDALSYATGDLMLTGEDVAKIPFMFSHKGTSLSLKRLMAEGEGWPKVLRDDALRSLREQYEQAVDVIDQVPEGEEIPDESIDRARDALGQMARVVKRADLPGPEAAEALRYIRAHIGMVAMLEEPDVQKFIEEAETVDEISLPNLLGFMQVFNLQFAAAEDPEEKDLYRTKLYPMLDRLHARMVEAHADQVENPEKYTANPANVFGDYELEDFDRGTRRRDRDQPQDRDQGEGRPSGS